MVKSRARTHRTSDRGTVEYARMLRKQMTYAESLLWQRLRKKSLDGFRFRRQHPIGPYIADFFCNEAALVVEVDGGIHQEQDQTEKDRRRDIALKQHRLAVLRFTNREIETDIESVLDQIKAALIERTAPTKSG